MGWGEYGENNSIVVINIRMKKENVEFMKRNHEGVRNRAYCEPEWSFQKQRQ